MATSGKLGRVLIRTLYPVISFLNEAMTANGTYTVYTITDSTKSYWYSKFTPIIYVDGTAVTTGYTINYLTGAVTFTTALTSSNVVTASGSYYLTTADSIAFTNEPTVANSTYKRYTIANPNMRYWDKDVTPTVKKNGTTVTTGYSIESPGGVVVFEAANLVSDTITVSGSYVTVEQISGFYSWNLKVDGTTIDVTDFESDEWGEFINGTKSWTVDAEKFWITSDDFTERFSEELIIVLYCDFGTTKTRFEGYAVISSDEIDTAVSDAIKGKISFSGSQGVYYRAAANPTELNAYDSFNRVDNASSLGTADTGETWVTLTGTPRIISNQASATTGVYRGYIETGITDCAVSAKFPAIVTAGAALMFRIVDVNNRYYVGVYPTSLIFGKFVSGTQTAITTVTLTFVAEEIVKAIVDGTSIKVYVNGVEQINTTDSDLTTGTKCGIGIGDADNYIDNFEIETI